LYFSDLEDDTNGKFLDVVYNLGAQEIFVAIMSTYAILPVVVFLEFCWKGEKIELRISPEQQLRIYRRNRKKSYIGTVASLTWWAGSFYVVGMCIFNFSVRAY